MGGLFWNKVIGAALATALVFIGIKELSHALIHSKQPETPGFAVVIESVGGGADKVIEAVIEISLAELLASASASSGERVAKKCAACHTFEQGGANKIGPNLWNILGETAAHLSDFRYSTAMVNSGLVWDFETLDAFLAKPKDVVPGTSMSFAGLRKAKDRANFLAWVRTKSEAPMAFPAFIQPAVENGANMLEGFVETASVVVETAETGAVETMDVVE